MVLRVADEEADPKGKIQRIPVPHRSAWMRRYGQSCIRSVLSKSILAMYILTLQCGLHICAARHIASDGEVFLQILEGKGILSSSFTSLWTNYRHYLRIYKHEIASVTPQVQRRLKQLNYSRLSENEFMGPIPKKYNLEKKVSDWIAKSPMRVSKIMDGSLFFVPCQCTSLRCSTKSRSDGQVIAEEYTKTYLQRIEKEFPQTTGRISGLDHFFICTHDMGRSLMSRVPMPIRDNSFGLIATATTNNSNNEHRRHFSADHDISVFSSWERFPTLQPKHLPNMTFLASFIGSLNGKVRKCIMKYLKNQTNFYISGRRHSKKQFLSTMRQSIFCLAPAGNVVYSPRILQCLAMRCIPVILADYYALPHWKLISWDHISLTVPENQSHKLSEILRSISPEKIEKLQRNLEDLSGVIAAGHLTWEDFVGIELYGKQRTIERLRQQWSMDLFREYEHP